MCSSEGASETYRTVKILLLLEEIVIERKAILEIQTLIEVTHLMRRARLCRGFPAIPQAACWSSGVGYSLATRPARVVVRFASQLLSEVGCHRHQCLVYARGLMAREGLGEILPSRFSCASRRRSRAPLASHLVHGASQQRGGGTFDQRRVTCGVIKERVRYRGTTKVHREKLPRERQDKKCNTRF